MLTPEQRARKTVRTRRYTGSKTTCTKAVAILNLSTACLGLGTTVINVLPHSASPGVVVVVTPAPPDSSCGSP